MSSYWKGDDCIVITNDPYHKRKGLYVGNKYVIQRIATVGSDKYADDFEKFFEKFLGIAEEVTE